MALGKPKSIDYFGAEKFVDLHSVAKQALRASVESYSIKELEKFYDFKRVMPLIASIKTAAYFGTCARA